MTDVISNGRCDVAVRARSGFMIAQIRARRRKQAAA